MTNDELPDNLARALKALDDDAARVAARLDATRVAGAVLERLRREPAMPEPSRRRQAGILRIAAAVVLLALGGVVAQRLATRPGPDGAGAFALSVPPADSMDAGQATELLAAVEQVRDVSAGVGDSATTTTATVSVEDLSETELRTLLRIMESSEDTK